METGVPRLADHAFAAELFQNAVVENKSIRQEAPAVWDAS